MERYSSFTTAGSPIKALPSDRGEERSSSSERSAAKELAERVGSTSLPTYAELEQQFKSEQAERTFASEVENCKEIGVRFFREPGPGGTIGSTPTLLSILCGSPRAPFPDWPMRPSLSIGPRPLRMSCDSMKRLSFPYEDRNYPFWRQTYDHIIEKLELADSGRPEKRVGHQIAHRTAKTGRRGEPPPSASYSDQARARAPSVMAVAIFCDT